MTVGRAAQIEQDRDTRRADGDVCQPETPGATKGVTDDDGEALACSLAECGSEISRGLVGVAGEERHDIVAGNVRMVDAGIGADEAVARFGDQHVIAADDAPRLFQNYFHEPGIFLLPLRDGLRLERRADCRQPDYGAFGLGDNFLRDDEDIAVFESDACFASSVCNLSGEILAEMNLRQSRQAKQAYTRTDNGRVLRG